MIYLDTNSYNISIAKIFGVCSSVFLSCIDGEFNYQFRNKLINNNNTISLSRSEIYERTGLDDTKQLDVENALSSCGVLSIKPVKNVLNKNYYILNSDILDKIIQADNPEDAVISEISKQYIKKPRVEPMSKRQTHIANLKKKIVIEDEVIKQYLCDWIDSVYTNPKGFLSPSSVSIAQQELQAYSKGNQKVEIELLKLAIKGGWRDLTWAIDHYEKNKSNKLNNNFAIYNDIRSTGTDVVNEAF